MGPEDLQSKNQKWSTTPIPLMPGPKNGSHWLLGLDGSTLGPGAELTVDTQDRSTVEEKFGISLSDL
jgi:hypothetical protein